MPPRGSLQPKGYQPQPRCRFVLLSYESAVVAPIRDFLRNWGIELEHIKHPGIQRSTEEEQIFCIVYAGSVSSFVRWSLLIHLWRRTGILQPRDAVFCMQNFVLADRNNQCETTGEIALGLKELTPYDTLVQTKGDIRKDCSWQSPLFGTLLRTGFLMEVKSKP